MRTIKALLAVTSLMVGTALAQADTRPSFQLQPYHAQYVASRSGMELGEANQRLTALGRHQYELFYRSHAQLLFLSDTRTERSLFRYRPESGRIIPYKYYYEREGTGDDEKLSLEFFPEKQRVESSKGNTISWQPEDLLDNQLYQLKVRQGLAEGKTDFRFDSIDEDGQTESQHFRVVTREDLQLPYGKLPTIKLEKVRESSRRQTFIWFAPQLNYTMVRLRQFKDGDEQADIRLTQYETGASSVQQ
ncbi:DUF3108 domain-containing protein [Saliniradius amylolyticus]|nr:DUF3108 domain-containing protein [Saliniradius amylolyticus]